MKCLSCQCNIFTLKHSCVNSMLFIKGNLQNSLSVLAYLSGRKRRPKGATRSYQRQNICQRVVFGGALCHVYTTIILCMTLMHYVLYRKCFPFSDHRANKTPNQRVEERRSSTENLREKRPAANGEAATTTKLKNNNR